MPDDPSDVRLVAQLAHQNILSADLARKVLEKLRELRGAGRQLSAREIVVRKGWVTRKEAEFVGGDEADLERLIDGYEITGHLGEGGMSHVFAAVRASDGADVALKVLKVGISRNPRAVERFVSEARLMIRLSHPNIVKGFDEGLCDGLHWFAMELVPGDNLLELLDKGFLFNEEAALYIIVQAAKALESMHRSGIVHRDVKPGNILLTKDNTVKLCDLGLAAEVNSATEGDTTVGTLHYISPEQARGIVDARSDIFSLGCTLFHIVTGKVPFEGEKDEDVLAARIEAEFQSPELKSRNISPLMVYFIKRMLAKEKEFRFQTPAELAADIDESIRGNKSLYLQPTRSGQQDLSLKKPFAERKQLKRPLRGRSKT
jgi:serine/threonine-protein kinase